MGCYGLAGSLHDAVALAAAFGPGAIIGFGTGEAHASDILAPAGQALSRPEVTVAVSLGRPKYFLSFGNFALDELGLVAGAIAHLAAGTSTGFMAACLAAPEQGRTVYQGHLFEGGVMRTNLVRQFAGLMDGAVGIVPHELVAGGAAGIRAACLRLKEQGKILALIDAISEDDCAAVAAVLSGMPLAGGSARFADAGGTWPNDPGTGRVAILSGALDRQTIFQLGVARAALAVLDLDFAEADPAAAAVRRATALPSDDTFIITSSVPPDRLTTGLDAAAILGEVAAGLAQAGISRFIAAGGQTARAVCAALKLTKLQATSKSNGYLWLRNGTIAISIKTPNLGGRNLFLSEFEPHLSLNDIAELAS
jgi:uncharacterized protein YgbK (DUF1537 family)